MVQAIDIKTEFQRMIENGQISVQALSISAHIPASEIEAFIEGRPANLENEDKLFLANLGGELSCGFKDISEDERVRAILESLLKHYHISINMISKLLFVNAQDIKAMLDGEELPFEVKYSIAVKSSHLLYILKRESLFLQR